MDNLENDFAQEINSEIQSRIEGFCADHTHMRSYINDSKSVIAEYNGRQIFEMLQNVDDQMRSHAICENDRRAQIEFNLDKKSLYFRNQGDPFSANGIKSIMYPHVSSKDNLTIGNKGLGSRSLLNWNPESIVIRSAGLVFTFSHEIVRQYVCNSECLNGVDGTDNLPVLTFPRIEPWDNKPNDWVTEIELVNVDYRHPIGNPPKSIENELEDFNPELMLFLPNLRSVEILITDGETSTKTIYTATRWMAIEGCNAHLPNGTIDEKTISKEKDCTVEFNTRWIAYRGRGEFQGIALAEGESSVYNYAIAVPVDEKKQHLFHNLYNYLPLRHVDISLPCLVHATVKLDGRRDVLVPHEVNGLLFGKVLPEAFKDFANVLRNVEDKVTRDRWLPYRLLTPQSYAGGYIGILYEKLNEIRREGEFLPCVDKTYRAAGKCFHFKGLLPDCDAAEFFNDHPELCCFQVFRGWPENLPVGYGDFDTVTEGVNSELKSQWEKTQYAYSDEVLAELAYILWGILNKKPEQSVTRKALILHGEDGKLLDGSTASVYTPASDDALVFPDYMQADFIAKKLWEVIERRFSKVIAKYAGEDNKLRLFCNRELKKVVEFEYYDRFAAAKKMITACYEWLTPMLALDDKKKVIRQLLEKLWENYRGDAEPGRQKEKVPLCVEEDGTVRYASDFLFESAKSIYGNLLDENVYLTAQRIEALFAGMEITDQHKFLKYLGVREDVRILRKEIDETNDYFSFLEDKGKKNGGLPPRAKCNPALDGKKIEVYELRDSLALKQMPLESFLLLLEREDDLFSILMGNEKDLTIKWREENARYSREFIVQWSYSAYQLNGMLSKVIFNENDKVLASLGWRSGKLRDGVSRDVLAKLGAKSKLADLSSGELYDLLKLVAEKRLKLTRDFYKKINAALVALWDRGEEFSPPQGLKVYATFAGTEDYYPASEVFYHDNPSHARVLVKDCKMLYLGSRVGVDNVCKNFGVKKLADSAVEILQSSPVDKVFQQEFETDFQGKACVLAVLLARRRDKDVKECLESVSCAQVKLVRDLAYKYNGGEERRLGVFEYIKSREGCFYLCVGETMSPMIINPVSTYGVKSVKLFSQTMAAILCDAVDSSSDELEKDFRECYLDYDEKLCELKDFGYWDEQTESVNIKPDYYQRHLRNMRNAFDTFKIQRLQPLIWFALNEPKNKKLQKFYRGYLERCNDVFKEAMQQDGVLEKYCMKNRDKGLDAISIFTDQIIHVFENANWTLEVMSQVLILNWNIRDTQDVVQWKEPDPKKLYPRLYNEEVTPEVWSLFFFEGNDNALKTDVIVVDGSGQNAAQDTADAEAKILTLRRGAIRFTRPNAVKVSVGDAGSDSVSTGKAMTENRRRSQKLKGDWAELKVKEWLESAPENKGVITGVDYKSGSSRSSWRSDASHYDLSYIKEGRTFYVEVKACDRGEFFITEGELEFARQHPDTYRLALVSEEGGDFEFVDNVYIKLLEGDVMLPNSWRISVGK